VLLEKVNAILLNININQPKLVDICRYKLVTNLQNFADIYLIGVKILQNISGRGYFLTHTVHYPLHNLHILKILQGNDWTLFKLQSVSYQCTVKEVNVCGFVFMVCGNFPSLCSLAVGAQGLQ